MPYFSNFYPPLPPQSCRMYSSLISFSPHYFNDDLKRNLTNFTNFYISTYIRWFLYLWFRAPLNYINNCPTRCNTKQSIYYSASSLYMIRVSNTPIIRSTQNCNYSLRYSAAISLQRGQASLAKLEGGSCTKYMTSTGGCSYSFVYSWWWVCLTPETCRVNLQNNK